jgi:hypothetical protein
VIDLTGQQRLVIVRFFPVGDIGGNAAQADQRAASVEGGAGGGGAPADLSRRSYNAKLDLARPAIGAQRSESFVDIRQIFGMEPLADLLNRRNEAGMIHAENAALPFIPKPGLGCQVIVPGSHIAGHQGQAAALLALPQAVRRKRQRLGSLRHPALEFVVELLQIPGLAKQFGKHPDFRPQQLGHHGHGNIIDRAGLISPQIIALAQMDGGNEDNRCLLKPRMFPDHLSQLETIQFRHADIHQNDRHLVFQQISQGFFCGRNRNEIFVQLGQHNLITQQLARLVIHQKHVDAVLVFHGRAQR